MNHEPLGAASLLGEALTKLASTIDARAGADPQTSYTAKLLMGGPPLTAKKLGEEAVELALSVVSESDQNVAQEAADLLYHVLVALRSRGVPLDTVARVLEARGNRSGLEEKASRP